MPRNRAGAGRERRLPAFTEELTGTLGVHAQYVLHGNIRDVHLVRHDTAPGGGDRRSPDRAHSLTEVLWNALRPEGYEALVRYNVLDGFSVVTGTAADEVRELLSASGGNGPAPSPGPGTAGRGAEGSGPQPGVERLLHSIVTGWRHHRPRGGPSRPGDARLPLSPRQDPYRVVLLIDYAARIPTDVSRLSDPERDFFLGCLKLAEEARPLPAPDGGRRLFNPLIWLVEGERDLPSWLVAGSERIRTIGIPLPDLGSRQRMARLLAADHRACAEAGATEPGAAPEGPAPVRLTKRPTADASTARTSAADALAAHPSTAAALTDDTSTADAFAVDAFARSTAGLTLRAMRESSRMALDRGLPFSAMRDAVRVYQLGVEDNPWQRGSVREQIRKGESYIRGRVKGQEKAVAKTLDILKRAALGLSGAQASHSGSRPRGVLFFAGPTGTGKTELAKSVATVLFGTEDACLRFDMSEFSAAHSVDRLVGAPPGYVGYEAGGELTTAVRNDPFRVVLFDEIDKADRGVLDKFLQVLEDGRLTDGQGVTTYFSECVLIFTSNLGVRGGGPAHPLRAVHGRHRQRRTRYRHAAGDPVDQSAGAGAVRPGDPVRDRGHGGGRTGGAGRGSGARAPGRAAGRDAGGPPVTAGARDAPWWTEPDDGPTGPGREETDTGTTADTDTSGPGTGTGTGTGGPDTADAGGTAAGTGAAPEGERDRAAEPEPEPPETCANCHDPLAAGAPRCPSCGSARSAAVVLSCPALALALPVRPGAPLHLGRDPGWAPLTAAALAGLTCVSRRQAVVTAEPDGTVWVAEPPVPSANGTRVNGVPVGPGERIRLRNGDEIRFGRRIVRLTVRIHGAGGPDGTGGFESFEDL
ncbi:FHA domain-containing protein [Streptomyces clavuligerus]|uniref:FHA domain-containing protein n=6 Tax=Streptomyces clavuligerus TaxID=1901 RepID=UPI0027B9CE4D|nr:AAA family ATPase [Streptomyces clavuligerus]